ncbi:hypothetical protein GUJ93_ZPchr0008g12128 [Zizania palustris]|uniref:Uncharacterized protein n=1 Tax=Zizania palustris TaxID=103762 RepID=A0A8J5RP66_ZIZPA|nr:hypothetical protein GUJ93_ZPchr0008g12128 [Zizania palustris]
MPELRTVCAFPRPFLLAPTHSLARRSPLVPSKRPPEARPAGDLPSNTASWPVVPHLHMQVPPNLHRTVTTTVP